MKNFCDYFEKDDTEPESDELAGFDWQTPVQGRRPKNTTVITLDFSKQNPENWVCPPLAFETKVTRYQCACGNMTFIPTIEHLVIWAVYLTCTKCFNKFEIQTE